MVGWDGGEVEELGCVSHVYLSWEDDAVVEKWWLDMEGVEVNDRGTLTFCLTVAGEASISIRVEIIVFQRGLSRDNGLWC